MPVTRIAKAPARPLLVWDGDCNFCHFWVRQIRHRTGDAVEYIPYQDARIADLFPEIQREQFETAVQLALPDGRLLSGAEAIFAALSAHGHLRWPYVLYRRVPGVAWVSELAYRFVASHRAFFARLTRLFAGSKQA